MPPDVLTLERISKSFGSTRALRDVTLALRAGEVHVLAGENGAGKSTLIKILSGVHTDYEGELRVEGRVARFANPSAARRAGIATIHQELSLVPNLSIGDNFLLVTPGPMFSLRPRRSHEDAVRAALARVGLDLSPETPVEALTLGDRQLVEIARALAEDARVLVMDEPTSALSEPEVERLFERISGLTAKGVGILYISHRMDEIYRVADRISVLSDGTLRLTEERGALAPEALVRAMVGRELPSAPGARSRAVAPPLLRVDALETFAPSPVRGLSFELGPGEIVGLAGLRGSGAGSVLEVLFGSAPRKGGRVSLGAREYSPRTPREARAEGVAYLPSDRALSVFPELSVLHNATLSSLPRFSPRALVDREKERTVVGERSRELGIKAPSLGAPALELSGGNQQKLALLRCLLDEPRLLLLDDPSRGVDVGARAEIYALLEGLAERGLALLVRSTDLDELCRLCDRVLVLFQGRLHATLARAELTRERLAPRVMGASA